MTIRRNPNLDLPPSYQDVIEGKVLPPVEPSTDPSQLVARNGTPAISATHTPTSVSTPQYNQNTDQTSGPRSAIITMSLNSPRVTSLLRHIRNSSLQSRSVVMEANPYRWDMRVSLQKITFAVLLFLSVMFLYILFIVFL